MSLQNPISPTLQNVQAVSNQLNNIANAVTKGIAGRAAAGTNPAVAPIAPADFLAAAPEPTRAVLQIVAAAVGQADAAKLAAALAALQ